MKCLDSNTKLYSNNEDERQGRQPNYSPYKQYINTHTGHRSTHTRPSLNVQTQIDTIKSTNQNQVKAKKVFSKETLCSYRHNKTKIDRDTINKLESYNILVNETTNTLCKENCNTERAQRNTTIPHGASPPSVKIKMANETVTDKRNLHFSAKSISKIGTWNIRTLNPSEIKAEIVVREMKRYNLELLGLCETRWIGQGEYNTIDGYTILYSGGTERKYGVGLSINKEMKKSLLSWQPISDRIMTARFQGKHTKISFIQVYAPTNISEEESKTEFYDLMQQIISDIPKHDIIICMGDINAQLSSDRKGHDTTLGPFGSANSHNDNGHRFLEFCTENELKIMNTFFEHKKIHKMTWTSPDGKFQSEIDYVCITKRWARSIQDVRAIRSADIGSDHELVVAKMKLKLKKVVKKTCHDRPYDINKFQDAKTKQMFAKTITDKMKCNEMSQMNVEDQWKTIKSTIKESADETIGPKRGNKREKWISDKSWELIDMRKLAKVKLVQDNNESSIENYKKLDKAVKKQTRIDKEKWLEAKAAEAERAANVNDTRTVYKIIKELSNKPSNSHVPIKNKDGRTLNADEDIEKRWIEHFSSVLNQPRPTEEMHLEDDMLPPLDIDTSCITIEEVSKALANLKNNKSPGDDQIHPEMLKYGGEAIARSIHYLCNSIWETGQIPEDWKTGTIIPLPKKGNLSDCSNWRGITLLSIPYKVMCIIILNRMKKAVDIVLRDEQSGFRQERSCTDAIFALRHILELTIAHQQPIFLHFVDFQKAFDSIHRDTMWKILKFYGIPQRIISILKEMYNGTKCCIRIGQTTTNTFDIMTGVRQGCILSPFLFTLLIDYILRQQDKSKSGITIGERQLQDLDFADDIVLIETTNGKLQEKTDALRSNAEKIGLRFNIKKCETMATLDKKVNIQIEMKEVENTNNFTYLGSKISSSGDSGEEIRSRIGKAGAAFGNLKLVLNSKNISLKTKLVLYNALVLSILLYGSETWTIYSVESKKLDAFHQRCLRRILGITYKDRVQNVEVFRRTGCVSLSNIIKERRLRWLGHVCRMNASRFPRQVLNWKPKGKRRRGRPRLSWNEMINRDLNAVGMKMSDAQIIAQNRKSWKSVTALCVNNTGGSKV